MAQLSSGITEAVGDTIYLRLDATNDPVTGEIQIDPTTDDYAIDAKRSIRIKAGRKLILDG